MYVRKGKVLSIFEMPESDAETLEMMVTPQSRVAGKAIRDAGLPSGAIIGAVVHHGEIVIPRGDTVFRPDDRVVVFATPAGIPDLEKQFARREGPSMVRFGLVLNRTSLVLVCIVPFMLTAIPFSRITAPMTSARSSWRPARPWSPVW